VGVTRVVVFTKPGCSRCEDAKKVLHDSGVEFTELNPQASAHNLALYSWCDPTDNFPRYVLLDGDDKVLLSGDGKDSVIRFAKSVLDMRAGGR